MDIFELFFWIVVGLIWVISLYRKTKKPLPKEEAALPEPYEKKPDKLKRVILEIKPETKAVPEKQLEIILKEKPLEAIPHLYFSDERLQEGIILSIILGPPKALSFLPEWRNGRRGSLKSC